VTLDGLLSALGIVFKAGVPGACGAEPGHQWPG